ncbi:XRE family transcriptional regulator [Mycolicibacterium mageritense]|uniref:XRE family transcriptional regulator n=1 Tax=Mycolicibacterium mageritense TaxID=53462 RepID=UPI001E3F78B4|nr:XRE family transcriptional regulator [Mycolicibacterium mageritense]GJJ16329.1 hypothetical protein MTY414_00020 [Mycolicibacterium mageritense]
MIRNERQYRVTLAQRKNLEAQLSEPTNIDVPEWVTTANRDAIRSQIADLDTEIEEYLALRDGPPDAISEVGDVSELPRALVRARIASKLTQRELAERLHLREQQIQRYEANDYAGASIGRIEEVMRALGVTLRGEVGLPSEDAKGLRRALLKLGIGRETINRRFIPSASTQFGSEWLSAASKASRIFGADIDELLDGIVPSLVRTTQFRASSAANRERVSGYARYVEYLAELLIAACETDYQPLPDLQELRRQFNDGRYRNPLEALLHICWQHGIPVLPLTDAGAFYGACFWIDERPAIALKNNVRSTDRWAFLLAHEMDHARHPGSESVLEGDLSAREWRSRPSEQAADQFAVDLLLGEKANAIVQVAAEAANRNIAQLKSVLPAVAQAGNVPVGILADHIAARLNAAGDNWWPTAATLHESDLDAWRLTRSVLFEYVDFARLDSVDREILIDGISQ